MRYKFKAQSSILVAGLLAASYADACYYAHTTAICFNSGNIVDKIYFQSAATYSSVSATADWIWNGNNYTTGTGVGGYNSYTTAAPPSPEICSGPAKWIDPASHTDTVAYWENGTFAGAGAYPFNPSGSPINFGTTAAGTCQ